MLDKMGQMGCRMSTKLHFLKCHLDSFPDNCGNYSDEQGEKLHQLLKSHEERYKGKNSAHMIADYIWNVTNVEKQ